MAKVSRDMLKTLVKECLFEILLESTGGSTEVIAESRRRPVPGKRAAKSKNVKSNLRPALDSISYASVKKKSTPAIPPPVDVSAITSDPIMASIFQDTASTTLQEQLAAESRGPVAGRDAVSQVVAQNDPASLFGEAANNWAALAFSDENE